MHFALPSKKSSFQPQFARASVKSATSQKRRKQIQLLGYGVLAVLTLYLFVHWLRASTPSHDRNGSISKDSSVMIVTVLDESEMSEDLITMIKANRNDYATRHGYTTLYANTSTYAHLTETSPSSWSLVPALRHAISLHPDVDYIWSLSPYALITNITISLHDHVFSSIPSLMLKDIPVVPPDSVIHTFSNVKPSEAYLIISQDIDNLAHTSFVLRNTQTLSKSPHEPKDTWTQHLLDAWFDPLYRSYAFQKAENHALEHIIQWHPTLLAKIIIVNQRRINSYNFQSPKVTNKDTQEVRAVDSMWKPGDLIVNFKGCMEVNERDCETEMRKYFRGWMKEVEFFDGKMPTVELKVKDYVAKDTKRDHNGKEVRDHFASKVHI